MTGSGVQHINNTTKECLFIYELVHQRPKGLINKKVTPCGRILLHGDFYLYDDFYG